MRPPSASIMPHSIPGRQDAPTDLLRTRIRQFFKALPAALAFDEEGIHDMRVATRRLGVLLPILARKPRGNRVKRAIREMKRLRRRAALSRDLDVSLALFEENEGTQANGGEEVAILKRRLRQARRRSHKRMKDELAHLDLSQTRQHLKTIASRGADDIFTVMLRLRGARDREASKLLRAIEEIGERYDPADLHRLRSRVRRLRYLAEMNTKMVERGADAPRLFREIQDALGHLHDANVVSLWLARQITSSEKRGQVAVAWHARRLRRAVEDLARKHHNDYLALKPAATVHRALRLMGHRESVA